MYCYNKIFQTGWFEIIKKWIILQYSNVKILTSWQVMEKFFFIIIWKKALNNGKEKMMGWVYKTVPNIRAFMEGSTRLNWLISQYNPNHKNFSRQAIGEISDSTVCIYMQQNYLLSKINPVIYYIMIKSGRHDM